MSLDAKRADAVRQLPKDCQIAAVVSSYHEEICGGMQRSAQQRLLQAGLAPDAWHVVSAPGTFELPLLAARLARRSEIDAVLCFGLVLKGETDHDRYIAQATAQGLMDLGLRSGKPILFGVLTCNTLEQAIARALPSAEGGKLDKGREVAQAAIDALCTLDDIDELKMANSKASIGFSSTASPASKRSPNGEGQ